MNRVTRMAVSGKYSWRTTLSPSTVIRKRPPRLRSSKEAKTLGESKRGQQNQSMQPSVPTRAEVCRSPINPCSAIAGYRSMATPPVDDVIRRYEA
jgi:hypothetical protein